MTTSMRLDRRAFLKHAALATGAAPFLLPGRVWSAETAPNSRITLGFIGMGTQNRSLMNGFLRRDDVRVLAVCDVDAVRLEHHRQLVDQHYGRQGGDSGECAGYRDFRELLERSDIDAVVIATPDHWHAIQAIHAAESGKDIYCEKPLCQSINEATGMVEAVRRNDRVLQTGSQQRSSREFRRACELIRNGRLGNIRHIQVGVGGPGVWCDLPEFDPPEELDWDFWLGPAPKRGWNEILSPKGVHTHFPRWRNYREYGGGMVTDWGAHHFDIVQWALDKDNSGPLEAIPADDPGAVQGVRLIYEGGIEVEHVSSPNGIQFNGDEGSLFVARGKLEVTPESLAEEPLGENAIRLHESNDHRGDWIASVRDRTRPICDVEIGARSVTVCHLVNLAYWHRQPLKWDPAANRFREETGNDQWLDVAYRDPWKPGRAAAQ